MQPSADSEFHPGCIYEDCSYHPCVCIGVEDGAIWGVSLIDGSYPRTCDVGACGVRLLSPEEAWQIKTSGPADPEARSNIALEQRWWRGGEA